MLRIFTADIILNWALKIWTVGHFIADHSATEFPLHNSGWENPTDTKLAPVTDICILCIPHKIFRAGL